MRRLLTALTATAIAAAGVVAPTTADARWRGWWAPALGGLAVGAIVGSALARPYYAYPSYGYAYVTRMAATVTRRTTGMVRPTTAIAIRRTTATATGITSATTPDVTDERLPAPIKEHGKGNPVRFLSVRLLGPAV